MKEAKKGSQGVLNVMKFITCFQLQCTPMATNEYTLAETTS